MEEKRIGVQHHTNINLWQHHPMTTIIVVKKGSSEVLANVRTMREENESESCYPDTRIQ